jgi:hypothetical protein
MIAYVNDEPPRKSEIFVNYLWKKLRNAASHLPSFPIRLPPSPSSPPSPKNSQALRRQQATKNLHGLVD